MAAGAVLVLSREGRSDTHPTGIPALNSRPGAAYTIYLDFAGFNYSGTWGNETPGSTPAFDVDGNPNSFSAAELGDISQIWDRVAEKYAAFNINVTTVDPALAGDTDAQRQAYYDNTADMMHTVIGGTGSWAGGPGGVSFIGVDSSSYPNGGGLHTDWVFPSNLGFGVSTIAEASAHENGHGLGLSHQSDYTGSTLVNEYSSNGGASGNGSYAPIMGASYSSQRGTWRMGTSDNGKSPGIQNDPQVIESNPGMGNFVDDGIGHVTGSATQLPLTGTGVNFDLAKGIITSASNSNPNPIGTANYTHDFFSFESIGGVISLTAEDGSERLTPGIADGGATLNSVLQILNASGTVVATAAPDVSTLFETYSGTLVPGIYYAEISSAGGYTSASTPYAATEYYDMGSFFLTGTGFTSELNLNQVTWNASGGGSWGAGSDWSGSVIPHLTTDAANFDGAITAPASVTLDAHWTVASININSSNSYTILAGAGGTLTLDAGGLSFVATIADLKGSHIISAPVTLNSGVVVSVTNAGDQLSLTGPVSGAGGLTKSGAGALVLAGNNSYRGATNFQAGIVAIASDNSINGGVGGFTFSGGILQFSNYSSSLSFNSVANLTLGSASGSPSQLNGAITGGFGLTYVGPGTLVLTASDTYGGGTNLKAGALAITNDNAIHNGSGGVNGCAQISGRWHNRDSPAGEPVFFGDMPWNGF